MKVSKNIYLEVPRVLDNSKNLESRKLFTPLTGLPTQLNGDRVVFYSGSAFFG